MECLRAPRQSLRSVVVTDVATTPLGSITECTWPFIIHMFGNTFTDIPIVEISIDSSLKPEKEWAVAELRFVDVPSKS
jgi:aromatic ring-opening dioxygenase catalytic subunit (LigB family)